MRFKEILKIDYKGFKEFYQKIECSEKEINKLSWLSEHVFGFATYDLEISSKLGETLLEVLKCLQESKMFDYIKISDKNYMNYIIIANLIINYIDWGSSIREAWLSCEKFPFVNLCSFANLDKIRPEVRKLKENSGVDEIKEYWKELIEFTEKEDNE